jgi:hypothetical protein
VCCVWAISYNEWESKALNEEMANRKLFLLSFFYFLCF